MNQNGSVLIFVLIFVAFTLGVVTLMHQQAGISMEDSATLQHEYQSSIYAMSAIEAVRELLEDDDNSYDEDGETWALLPPFPVEGGFISITITPTDGRIPLNLMDNDNDTTYYDACKGAMKELELDEYTCSVIKDWIDENHEISDMGEESITYEIDGRTYHVKNGQMETLRELMFINKAKDNFNVMSDHFTNIGTGKLNLNFVTREALIGLIPSLAPYADDIIEYRKKNIYKDVSNIMNAATIPMNVFNNSVNLLSVKSSFFYVKTEVNLNDVSRFYHVLLSRDGTRTRVVKYIEGKDGVFF